jgi:hypothetical protein
MRVEVKVAALGHGEEAHADPDHPAGVDLEGTEHGIAGMGVGPEELDREKTPSRLSPNSLDDGNGLVEVVELAQEPDFCLAAGRLRAVRAQLRPLSGGRREMCLSHEHRVGAAPRK